MSISFGRKINYLPLLISLVIGLVVGYFLYLLSTQIFVGILFGILTILACSAIYAIHLASSYGFWKIDESGIRYDDYRTTNQRFKALLTPMSETETLVKFADIQSFAVVVGKSMPAPKGIGSEGAIDGSFYVVDSALLCLSNTYFISLKLKDGEEIDLNLTTSDGNSADVENTIELLEAKTNTKASLVKQSI